MSDEHAGHADQMANNPSVKDAAAQQQIAQALRNFFATEARGFQESNPVAFERHVRDYLDNHPEPLTPPPHEPR